MVSFRSLTADRRPFDAFKARVRNSANPKHEKFRAPLDLQVFQWLEATAHGEAINDISSVEELNAQSRGAVRVV